MTFFSKTFFSLSIISLFLNIGFAQSGQANLTWYTSYPDPGSEECVVYNGCQWAGYFYGLQGQQSEEWVSQNNIFAIHEKDWDAYGLKTLRVTQGNKQIDGVIYDLCSDSDCNGCCTQNATQNGLNFLLDMESYTKDRFGSSYGIVDWECLDCSGPVAPSFTSHPSNQSVTEGQTASFSVSVTGVSLSYQWRKNGSAISGATSASYTTPTLALADNGSTYSVTVSNSGGSITSNSATLTVNQVPSTQNNRKVISWVPPYSIPQSKTILQQNFGGGIGIKDGLTHLALQFWIPSDDRKSAILSPTFSYAISDAEIEWFKNWGQANGVKVLLCVYNADVPGSTGWDWDAATSAFVDNQDSFAASLISEMDKYGLDGIEVDLEGPGADNSLKSQFLSFMTKLSNNLKPRGKDLTVATFAYIWNAPNSSWWPDLMNIVDGVTSMGYEEIGRNASGWASYSSQKSYASVPQKLMIGMPGTQNSWQGNTVEQQIDWVIQDGETGVAIWDITLEASGWQTQAVWQKLAQIKGSTTPTTYTLSTSGSNGSVTLSPSGGSYESGTVVSMTANPNSGYQFSSWSGDKTGSSNPTTITMDGNKNVSANFITVASAPVITSQPSDQTKSEGQTATFSVTATGSSLNYQWKKNGSPISGATSSSYTTPTLSLSDNGNSYLVTVSNSEGSVNSTPAILSVVAAVNLLSNPGFENGTQSWSANTVNLSVDSNSPYAGVNAGFTTGRTSAWQGIYQDVISHIQSNGSGQEYYVEAYVKLASGTDNIVVDLAAELDGVWTTIGSLTGPSVTSSGYTKISGTITAEWAGTLTSVFFRVQTSSGTDDFYLDDVYFGIGETSGETSHAFSIVSGWNQTSFNAIPTSPSAENVFGSLAAIKIVKDNSGNTYWPEFNINTLGDVQIGQGYSVFSDAVGNITFNGTVADPETPINLSTGWNFIGYLPTSDMSIETALNGIVSNIDIVKNNLGHVYWPEFNINQIGNMVVGKGYRVHMKNPATLTYPTNLKNHASTLSNYVNVKPQHFTNYPITGSSATLLASKIKINGDIASDGSEIGAFDKHHKLVGSGVINQGRAVVTIWGDDGIDSNLKGLGEGEPLTLKVWDKLFSYPLELPGEEPMIYNTDAIIRYDVLEAKIPGKFRLFNIIPNPFKTKFMISFELPQRQFPHRVTIKLLDLKGRLMALIADATFTSGKHNVNFIPQNNLLTQGVYLVKIVSENQAIDKKVIYTP